jgi:cold shock protein
MQGTIQRIRAERGFGFLRDAAGAEVFFHHSALPSPDHFATLAVGMTVEFEAEMGPKGLRAAKITVTPLRTPPLRSFQELAGYFHGQAAG